MVSPLQVTTTTKIPSLHPINRAWLHDGPLSPRVPAYVSRSLNYGKIFITATTGPPRSCSKADAGRNFSKLRVPQAIVGQNRTIVPSTSQPTVIVRPCLRRWLLRAGSRPSRCASLRPAACTRRAWLAPWGHRPKRAPGSSRSNGALRLRQFLSLIRALVDQYAVSTAFDESKLFRRSRFPALQRQSHRIAWSNRLYQ